MLSQDKIISIFVNILKSKMFISFGSHNLKQYLILSSNYLSYLFGVHVIFQRYLISVVAFGQLESLGVTWLVFLTSKILSIMLQMNGAYTPYQCSYIKFSQLEVFVAWDKIELVYMNRFIA